MRHMILAVALLATGCAITVGSGERTTETRSVTAFTELSNSTQVDVHITLGESTELALTCDDNVLDLIRTTVRDGRLVVDHVPGTTFNTTEPCVLDIQATTLERVVSSGSGAIDGTGPFSDVAAISDTGSGGITLRGVAGEGLSVVSSGSGTIELSGVAVDTFTVSSTGSGGLVATGAADTATVTCSGSGDVDLSGLAVTDATVSSSGSGAVSVNATGAVTGSLSGSGSVFVTGGASVNLSDTGSGDVVSE